MRAILRIDAERAADLARRRRIAHALEGKEHLDPRQVAPQARGREQFRAGDLPTEGRAMHEGIALQRIADLDVAVDGALDTYPRRGQVRHVEFDGIDVAIGVAFEADRGR